MDRWGQTGSSWSKLVWQDVRKGVALRCTTLRCVWLRLAGCVENRRPPGCACRVRSVLYRWPVQCPIAPAPGGARAALETVLQVAALPLFNPAFLPGAGVSRHTLARLSVSDKALLSRHGSFGHVCSAFLRTFSQQLGSRTSRLLDWCKLKTARA